DKEALITNSQLLEKILRDFDVEGRVVEVRPGPVVTTYEFEPAPGVKVGKITNLEDDLALAMKAVSIRILAPIPGKAVVGIEVPSPVREKIFLREVLESPAFQTSRSRLTLALGMDISGMPFTADLARMPHLLVAGATGAGKSVSVNAMVLSILFKSTPEDVRFLMIDPKMLELSAYEGIPHLLAPVVTNSKRATVMLKGIVSEMERRYGLMSEKGAKNIEQYNEMLSEKPGEKGGEHKKLPYVVVVIDELADLMMASGKDVEESLVRLSQMSRAAGINLIVATQRPSVDVITGLIKTNFPARISFQVPSKTDSRTILDAMGAEALLGDGDMLFMPPGSTKLKRVHGVYVSEREIKRVADFIKKQGMPAYEKEMMSEKAVEKTAEGEEELGEDFLEKYREAVKMASALEMISTSYIQRRFRIGYNTAARIIEKMEEEGIVGPAQGSRPREVLKRTIED
ncbi:MAG: DNA translocase FtsK, partial [Deltaproteobacteria bacterium]|nr:DNA translocase FtsK [Deltaproteobacteria bacterium]